MFRKLYQPRFAGCVSGFLYLYDSNLIRMFSKSGSNFIYSAWSQTKSAFERACFFLGFWGRVRRRKGKEAKKGD